MNSRFSAHLAGLLVSTGFLPACGREASPRATPTSASTPPLVPAPAATPAATTTPEATPAPPTPTPPATAPGETAEDVAASVPDALRAAVAALVAQWLEAQNTGDFGRYAALYAPDFKGVRRTATGAPKTFDLAGWKADRATMFERRMEVAADGVTVSADTTPGVTVVTFTQRWRSGSYADHGQKVLKVRLDDGALRVVLEDMRTSTAGWEDDRIKAADLRAMTAPLTVRVSVDRVAPPDAVGDCLGGQMAVVVTDAAGRSETIAVGAVTGMAGDAPGLTWLAPTKRGRHEDLGTFCAGLQAGWRVEQDGDFLIATELWNDEVTGHGRHRRVLAQLAAGAEVRLE